MNLTPGQEKWLKWLGERGGSAAVDNYGHLVANGEPSSMSSQPCFLHLIAKGYVEGSGDGHLQITEKGAKYITP